MSIEAQLDQYVKNLGYKASFLVRPEVDPVTRQEVPGTTVYVAKLHDPKTDLYTQGASTDGYGMALRKSADQMQKMQQTT